MAESPFLKVVMLAPEKAPEAAVICQGDLEWMRMFDMRPREPEPVRIEVQAEMPRSLS